MKVILQRVAEASVEVDAEVVGSIGPGLLLLVGIAQGDSESELRWMADKVAGLRVFRDDEGKMNRSVLDTTGEVLAISQFTLMADTRKGKRPSFVAAARPEIAEPHFDRFCEMLREKGLEVATGRFGADMAVRLHNDGPVTIPLERKAEGV